MQQEVIAKLNHLKIAPRKVRLLTDALKGMSVNQAEAQLLFRTQRSRMPLLHLLKSAAANAKNNFKLDPEKLFIKNIRVDQGPTLKRFLPRAMGRATPIHKKTSHVTLVLAQSEKSSPSKFMTAWPKKVKKTDAAKKRPKKETKPVLKSPNQAAKKVGFFKRIFQRKAV